MKLKLFSDRKCTNIISKFTNNHWHTTIHSYYRSNAKGDSYIHIYLLLIKIYLWHNIFFWVFSSVQFSLSVVSDSLQLPELQPARPPCPSPIPRVHPNPCPLSQWCHPTISSSVVPFSSCPQSFPASGSFQMCDTDSQMTVHFSCQILTLLPEIWGYVT